MQTKSYVAFVTNFAVFYVHMQLQWHSPHSRSATAYMQMIAYDVSFQQRQDDVAM